MSVVLPGISGVRHGLGVGSDRDGTHEHTQCPIIRMAENSFLCSRLVKGLDAFLERAQDRELFDLAPIEKSPAPR